MKKTKFNEIKMHAHVSLNNLPSWSFCRGFWKRECK